MKKTLLLLSAVVIASCGGSGASLTRTNFEGTQDQGQDAALTDCSGHQSEMKVPYGISTTTAHILEGGKFAKLVAVDSMDGKMKVTILPPDGENKFAASLIDELVAQGYKIRIIACRENPSSVVSGFSTTGVCNPHGPINIIGKEEVAGSDFTNDGFVANGSKVHATHIAAADSALKPNFIMITAGITSYEVGDIMIAYARSPYYSNGCYSR